MDGEGSWGGAPTEYQREVLLKIIQYSTLGAEDFNEELKRLIPQLGTQQKRPQVKQFMTMMATIKVLRASPEKHDHTTANALQKQLDSNLANLKNDF